MLDERTSVGAGARVGRPGGAITVTARGTEVSARGTEVSARGTEVSARGTEVSADGERGPDD